MRPRIARNREPVDVAGRHVAHLEAPGDRAVRKPGNVLDAAVTFLFNGGDQASVLDEHRRDVAMVRVEAENVHEAARVAWTYKLSAR